MAIIDIKKQYNLTEWTGDPCSPYPFDWVTCSVDPAGPRITSLWVMLLPRTFCSHALDKSAAEYYNIRVLSFLSSVPTHLGWFVCRNLSNKNLSGTIAQGISNLTAVTLVWVISLKLNFIQKHHTWMLSNPSPYSTLTHRNTGIENSSTGSRILSL